MDSIRYHRKILGSLGTFIMLYNVYQCAFVHTCLLIVIHNIIPANTDTLIGFFSDIKTNTTFIYLIINSQ